MRVKNLTPFLFAPKVTSRRPPQPEMALIVRGSFRLSPGAEPTPIESLVEQGPMSAQLFREEDEERTGICLHENDFADFKLRADLLLTGSCHAPDGRPAKECAVRFAVGSWSKSLLVVGNRVWKGLGVAMSEPEPFTVMPLLYSNAFGGPGYEKNPSGKGFGALALQLPNVEYAASRILSKSARPEPAGFGPINAAWPQHSGGGLGNDYGGSYRKNRFPFYSADFDWAYFNDAPSDQQLKGYLRGDEVVTLQNLHAKASTFQVRLPGLRVRGFIKNDDGEVLEAPVMNLDTLHADGDAEKLSLTWRGHVPVRETDMSSVKFVLIASEKLEEAPLPISHYRAILEAFEKNPVDADAYAPGAGKAIAAVKSIAAENESDPDRSPVEQMRSLLANPDIVGILPEEQRAEALKRNAALLESLPPKSSAPPTPTPRVSAELVKNLEVQIEKVDGTLKTLRAMPPSKESDELTRTLEAARQQAAALIPARPEEIGPGKDLAGRNLMQMDLAGADLSGANLEGANLARANLSKARLTKANLKSALLAAADLSGADLSDANLTKAMLAGIQGEAANFSRATLDQSLFPKARLVRAIFDGCHGKQVIFVQADLTESLFRHTDFFQLVAEAAALGHADFSDAKLVRCSFGRAKGANAIFAKATLNNSGFFHAELRDAKFAEARGEGVSFMGADISGADFRLAAFHASLFMETRATGTDFYGADLRKSHFRRACLDRAEFVKANLFGALLGKASLNRTRFRDANLYGADLLDASGKDTDLVGANTKRAVFQASDLGK